MEVVSRENGSVLFRTLFVEISTSQLTLGQGDWYHGQWFSVHVPCSSLEQWMNEMEELLEKMKEERIQAMAPVTEYKV